jgi:hypothetical protein
MLMDKGLSRFTHPHTAESHCHAHTHAPTPARSLAPALTGDTQSSATCIAHVERFDRRSSRQSAAAQAWCWPWLVVGSGGGWWWSLLRGGQWLVVVVVVWWAVAVVVCGGGGNSGAFYTRCSLTDPLLNNLQITLSSPDFPRQHMRCPSTALLATHKLCCSQPSPTTTTTTTIPTTTTTVTMRAQAPRQADQRQRSATNRLIPDRRVPKK